MSSITFGLVEQADHPQRLCLMTEAEGLNNALIFQMEPLSLAIRMHHISP